MGSSSARRAIVFLLTLTLGASVAPRNHLRIDGTCFVDSSGQTFQWRGITAFRLLDYVSDKKDAEVEQYLSWASSHGLTFVRVLAMGRGFLNLEPAEGRAALPRLLEMAGRHRMVVEVVALAGTAEIPIDLDEHVRAIGRILADHGNGVLEIANEPVHPSQSPEVHKPEVLARLAKAVPKEVPVSLGSVERGDGFAAGSYVTWHAPRDNRFDGWGHVLALAEGQGLLERWKKPVVSDEPIGAGPRHEPGRRDDMPGRFRAAALLTRLIGLGATFHYNDGLQAKIPSGRELECFDAWNEAWQLLPDDVERIGAFKKSGEPGAVVRGHDRTAVLGVFERATADRGWVLVVGGGDPKLQLAAGWERTSEKTFDGMRLLSVSRSSKGSPTGP